MARPQLTRSAGASRFICFSEIESPISMPWNGLRISVVTDVFCSTASASPGVTAAPPARKMRSTRSYGVDEKKN